MRKSLILVLVLASLAAGWLTRALLIPYRPASAAAPITAADRELGPEALSAGDGNPMMAKDVDPPSASRNVLPTALSAVPTTSASSLSGYVWSPESNPVVNELIWASDVGQLGKPVYEARTNSDGWYTFAGIRSGQYLIRVLSRDYKDSEDTVVVEGQMTRNWILERGGRIDGVVVDTLGRPLAGVRVQSSGEVRAGQSIGGLSYGTSTDGKGLFMLEGLESGDYDLSVQLPKASRAAFQIDSVVFGPFRGGTSNLVLAVPGMNGEGTLSVRASERVGGAPIAKFDVIYAYDITTLPWAKGIRTTTVRGGGQIAGRDGAASRTVEEGLYFVSVLAEGFGWQRQSSVSVRSGGVTEVTMVLDRP